MSVEDDKSQESGKAWERYGVVDMQLREIVLRLTDEEAVLRLELIRAFDDWMERGGAPDRRNNTITFRKYRRKVMRDYVLNDTTKKKIPKS